MVDASIAGVDAQVDLGADHRDYDVTRHQSEWSASPVR